MCHNKQSIKYLEQCCLFRSTLWQTPPNKAGLKCPYLRTCVCTHVRPSTKSFFDLNEIWRVRRGRWVCMTVCSMNRSKVKVTSPSKLEMPCANPAIFNSPLPRKRVVSLLEMACFGAFLAVFFVRKMLNFPPDMVITWTLKCTFWK